MIKVSCVINTLNEEANIGNVLRSVHRWVDEIIIVDMHSSDKTVEIAKEYGAQIYLHEQCSFVEPARQYACEQATGEWILILDADEIVTPALAKRLRQIAEAGEFDIVTIPFLNYLIGAPLLNTGWGPHQERKPRFFKNGIMKMDSAIHSHFSPRPGSRRLDLPYLEDHSIVHFNYLDFDHFIDKLNRYTKVEAAQALGRGESESPFDTLRRAARTFYIRYWAHKGYKDGWRGLYLSLFMVFYTIATRAKLRQLQELGETSIRDIYQSEANRLLNAE